MAFQWDLYEFYLALWEAPAYHLILEGLLLLWVLWLIFRKSYNPAEVTNLTEKEKEELIATWEPEPLVPTPPKSHPALNPRVVDGRIGKYINLDGRHCLNLASHNYLGLADSQELDNAAIKCLKKYGVGSCGPRGFYGTVDVHLELESRLAKFMNCEEAALYSYGFSTIASAIPAYAKRGDVIFADEAVSFAVQKGLDASRSDIRYFRHNDVNHLRELLEKQAVEEIKNPKKAKVTRKFIVVEGVYMNTGTICPLPDIVELKSKHKVRLFIDETVSFGTLGHSGRGITEYYGIPVDHVDLIMASLEHALSSIGGFCVGTSYVVDHQRLSGLGYCFSASLPPMLAAAAMASLDLMEADDAIQEESKGSLFKTLRDRCRLFHQTLSELAPYLVNESEEESPIKHLRLGTNYRRGCRTHDEESLRNITEEAAKRGVAIVVAAQLPSDRYLKDPSIRITVNRLLTDEEIRQAVSKLHQAAESVLGQSLVQ